MEKLIALIVVLVIMGLAIGCGVARYRECRRVHPVWYCIGDSR